MGWKANYHTPVSVTGVVHTNGQTWHDMRKFTVASMRDFGMGKKSLEERIQEEARVAMEVFSETEEAFYPRELLLKLSSNIICNICFGQRSVA